MKLFYKNRCLLSCFPILPCAKFSVKTLRFDGVDPRKKRPKTVMITRQSTLKRQVPASPLLDDGTVDRKRHYAVPRRQRSRPPTSGAPVSSLAFAHHTLEWLNYIATELRQRLYPLFRLTRRKRLNPPFAPVWKRVLRACGWSRFQTTSGFAASVLPAGRLSVYRIALGLWRKTEYGRVNAW